MKRIISALTALFCLAALLCGCSGDGTESSTAAESTSIPVPEPESSAPESIEPKPESSEPEPAVLVGEIIPAVARTFSTACANSSECVLRNMPITPTVFSVWITVSSVSSAIIRRDTNLPSNQRYTERPPTAVFRRVNEKLSCPAAQSAAR